MARERNVVLAALLREAGWSQPQTAAAVARVAAESGVRELEAVSRSHIAMWVQGTQTERTDASYPSRDAVPQARPLPHPGRPRAGR